MDGDKPVSYWKGDAGDFENPNPSIKWVEMINDPSIGEISKPHKAGIIAFKLSIKKREGADPYNFLTEKAWINPPPPRPAVRSVRAYIFQCRDLPNADDDSLSDPYVKIWS